MIDIPFVSIGNEELKNSNNIKKNDIIKCPHCGKTHTVKAGKNVETDEDSSLLYYKCNKTNLSYMCGIGGKAVFATEVVRNKKE